MLRSVSENVKARKQSRGTFSKFLGIMKISDDEWGEWIMDKADLQSLEELARKLSLLEKIQLMESLLASLKRDVIAQLPAEERPALAGIWEDVRVSPEDIDEVRREMWKTAAQEDIR